MAYLLLQVCTQITKRMYYLKYANIFSKEISEWGLQRIRLSGLVVDYLTCKFKVVGLNIWMDRPKGLEIVGPTCDLTVKTGVNNKQTN